MVQLLDELRSILARVETELDVHLTGADWAEARVELIHVFVHEACHAALSSAAPWVHALSDEQHTAVDEVTARLLEDQIAQRLDLYVHAPEQHVRELNAYPVRITVDQYKHLRDAWRRRYGPSNDLDGIARYVLAYLYPQHSNA